MDISFESSSARGAFRTSLPGLSLRIEGYSSSYGVKDFSVNGLAFSTGKENFEVDQQFKVDFILGTKEILTGLEIKIVRDIGEGLMGCIYIDLDKYQEARLDKLVLEVQKRMIQLRKKKGAS